MKIIDNPKKEKWDEICSRLSSSYSENEETVAKIFKNIENEGDKALKEYTLKYDKVSIDNFLISESEISNSVNRVDYKLKKAITRKTGARGLRSILEEILLDSMYEIPSDNNINEVVLNEDVVLGKSKPIVAYAKNKKGIETSA